MIDKGRSDGWKELIKKDYLFNYTPLGIIESLISTKFPLLSHIPHPFLTVSFHMVKRFDHSLTNIRKNIFDRSYRIKRQSLSRKFIVTHIPLHISRPNLSLPSTCHPLPHCATRTDNNEDAFYPEGGRKKKKENARYTADEGIFEFETTRHVEYTGSGGAVPSSSRLLVEHHRFFFSFFHSFSSFFLFFLFFPPQHPCSLWGTHYRCSFHVISESHSRHLGRLYKRDDYRSVVEPGFFLPFLFFYPLFISRFATYQNPFGILIRQILIRYWINVHNESFFLVLLFIFIYRFLYLRAKRGWEEGNIIFAKIEFFLEIFFVIGYETCHGPYLSARTSANIRSLAD